MSKPLQTLVKLGGMLTVLLNATTVSPLKASAQSLLPDINLLEGGQICLALCTSPRSTVPSSQGLGALPSQVLQLPGQALQIPQQILSPQGTPIVRSNLPIAPNNLPMMPPGNLPFVPGNAPPPPQPMQPNQPPRPTFLQKIAPVLPQLIQQFSR